MKRLLLIVLPLLLIVGCSKPVEDSTLINIDGLRYHPDTKELYSGKVFKNHMGGEKKFEGCSYKDGKKDGLWTEWYENGQKEWERTYINGRIEGLYSIWYNNGQKECSGNIKDQRYNGIWTFWDKDGVKYEGKMIREGDEDGTFFERYGVSERLRIATHENYINGKREGLFTEWWSNGQKEIQTNYENDEKEGLLTEWRSNGKKKKEGNYINGKREGLFTEWWSNGHKEIQTNYENDEKEGLLTEWYKSGKKKRETNYKDGKSDGLSTEWNWYKYGQKSGERTYKDGNEDGLHTRWYENGQKSHVSDYNDYNNPLETEYYENGDPKWKGTLKYLPDIYGFYSHVYYDGKCTYWDQDGVKYVGGGKRKFKEQNGTFFDYDGEVFKHSTIKNKKRDGVWTTWWYKGGKKKSKMIYDNDELIFYQKWYENGQKRSETNYKDGELDGLRTKWYDNGQKKFEGTFKDGELVNVIGKWNEDGSPR
jgi:antitoxin component YwqK of YwqJK toxin-antitoxin module